MFHSMLKIHYLSTHPLFHPAQTQLAQHLYTHICTLMRMCTLTYTSMSITGMQNNVERYLCCKQLKFTLNTVAYLFNLITLQYLPCHVQYCTINSTEKSMLKNFPLSTSKNHMKK